MYAHLQHAAAVALGCVVLRHKAPGSPVGLLSFPPVLLRSGFSLGLAFCIRMLLFNHASVQPGLMALFYPTPTFARHSWELRGAQHLLALLAAQNGTAEMERGFQMSSL